MSLFIWGGKNAISWEKREATKHNYDRKINLACNISFATKELYLLSKQLLTCFLSEFSKPYFYSTFSAVWAYSISTSWLPNLSTDSAQFKESETEPGLVCVWQNSNKTLRIHTKSTLEFEIPISLNYEHTGDHDQPPVSHTCDTEPFNRKAALLQSHSLWSGHSIMTCMNFRLIKGTNLHTFPNPSISTWSTGRRQKKKKVTCYLF